MPAAARKPRSARLQRLVGRGLSGLSAVQLGLCAAGLCLLLREVPPQAWQSGPADAEAGAEQPEAHDLTWNPRRSVEDDTVPRALIGDGDGDVAADDISAENDTNASTTLDAMAAVGGKGNSKEDDKAILNAIFLYWVVLSPLYLAAFVILRRWFPLIVTFYTTRAAGKNKVPIDVPETLFGWVKPIATVSRRKDLVKIIGLDQAMALEFPELCLKISLYVAGPMILITCPINYFTDKGREDLDFLSQLGTANLGQSESPIWWAHAAIVWYVVAMVCKLISDAEDSFVTKRFEWLKSLPEPRATTLMVENIPEEYQSDTKLREVFSETPDDVKCAHTAKRTTDLKKLVAKSESMVQNRKKATFKNNKADTDGIRELVTEKRTGETHDAETYWADQESELYAEIQAERRKVLHDAEKEGGVNTSTGFVTFRSQSSATAAYSARVTRKTDEFVMSFPPDPQHVLYDNLGKDPDKQELFTALGYVAIFFLFFFFLTVITSIVSFSAWLQNVEELAWARGILQAIAGPLVYTTVVGFLPTIFRQIFQTFWVLPSEPYLQDVLYTWYFWFLYVFVLFMSVIGSNPILTAKALAKDPETIPTEIADKLPNVSNFYVSLIILQVSTHVLNMVRHVQVGKYLVFRTMFTKKDAKKKAEPEDQDFYGVGSRSARWINTMLIGLVYCQIQPFLLVFSAVHFLVCKFVYGHLIVFAEERKADVGGGIFQDQLWHLHFGLGTYIILMSGYLANRSSYIHVFGVPISPYIVCLLSLVYLVRSARKMGNVDCQVLPRNEVPKHPQLNQHDETVSYIQPELLEKKASEDVEDDWPASENDMEESDEGDDDSESP